MSDLLQVKLIQVEHGDAILVSYGHSPVRHILVDGGPAHALPSLLEVLAAARVDEVLTLEALVVTHYDFDHIGGIIALLKQRPGWLRINDIWFNGHKHLLPRDVLGPHHGDALSDLIERSHLPWNSAFVGKAVTVLNGGGICLPDGMVAWVLSPTAKELSALAKQWPMVVAGDADSAPRDRLGRNDSWPPPSFFSLVDKRSPPDTSVSNASSIALLLQFKHKQVLLSGDAHSEVIRTSLAARWPGQKLVVDLLKVSHHGSQSNTSTAMLGHVSCRRFAISTNGRIHAHPDQALIARLIGSTSNAELIFNYRTPSTAKWKQRPLAWPKYITLYPGDDDPFVNIVV
ncbi:ComEC/Rec2 family competence protein [Pseudoduganella aquatica]|uniref:ComEC/Rec2 family competence protein n=1 Tax=Pseudoduganella aquatica TaxID=2660641 RepID=UPI001E5325C1|nr:MBL fold metallo-hydrolase [Pseudoduganella aquatica]